jgi:hypothetical protein
MKTFYVLSLFALVFARIPQRIVDDIRGLSFYNGDLSTNFHYGDYGDYSDYEGFFHYGDLLCNTKDNGNLCESLFGF